MRQSTLVRAFTGGLAGTLGAALALASAGCGAGGGAHVPKPVTLVQFQFVDASLTPSFPPGTQSLPRNARLLFVFSETVDPSSINAQTIRLRHGPQFGTVPMGSFQVSGNLVYFDPTVTTQAEANPFGLPAVSQFRIELPAQGQSSEVVRNFAGDPLLVPYAATFATGEGFLRELVAPEVLSVDFLPAASAVTGQVPGNGVLRIRFSEAIDPASVVLSTSSPEPKSTDTVDVRYADLSPDPNVNSADSLENQPVSGTFSYDRAVTTYTLKPTFSFGTKKYVFTVSVFQGVRDLAGNRLVNPRSFGPFTCDGTGMQDGRLLVETFDGTTDADLPATTADWGRTEMGVLQGPEITSRRAYVTGYQEALANQAGQYVAEVNPLIGRDLNQQVQNVNPPTSQGRRVLWAFRDTEIGVGGSITTCSWGPDSNVTFAARYPNVVLRIGFQKSASLSLAATFSGNYLGTPVTVYQGPYDVTQSTNVGDEIVPTPTNTLAITNANQMDPLFNFTGFVDWPPLTSYFDWDEGDPQVAGDRVLLLDASVQEGDSWNAIRGWYARAFPGSPALLAGYPTRRMLATYEEDVANPTSGAGVLNPEPSLTDTAFTITTRKSVAQSRFYTPAPGDPSLNPAGPPSPPFSSQRSYGADSDYLPVQILPAVQAGGAQVLVEFQGATALESPGIRDTVNTSFPFTPFTDQIDDCDGYPYIRWRITLVSNLLTGKVARVDRIAVPVVPK